MKTNIDSLTGSLPLFLQYGGQYQPQSAHIDIETNGTVTYETNSEIGNAVPISVWNGRTRRITIPNDLTARGYEQIHESIAADLEILIAGMDEKWDGSNWVGTLTEEAEEALRKLEQQSCQGEWQDFDRDEQALAELES